MTKSLSITVHPSAAGAEYLSVSDAMHQVLDLIEVLERAETAGGGKRLIVWRLTEAHTNSPPFSVTAEAFPIDPVVSVGLEASRVVSTFAQSVKDLLQGHKPDWISPDLAPPLKRALLRNLNGIGRTEIVIEDEEPFYFVPSNARTAVVTLERLQLDLQAAVVDYSRTEFGSIEVEVQAITRWNGKPALTVIERLSRDKITCVLTAELAELLGPKHKWGEAWEGQRLLVSGALHYGPDGSLKRVDAEMADNMPWTDLSISDLRDIDILQGRSVSEHLRLLRGGELG
ncbi:MAG: hypothetical protein HQL40_02920 [Alphaproteobacteria bacterium]|nr:hypothetical protein [Alphaproteobacteria bacterium]